jgi:hypothetical protein
MAPSPVKQPIICPSRHGPRARCRGTAAPWQIASSRANLGPSPLSRNGTGGRLSCHLRINNTSSDFVGHLSGRNRVKRPKKNAVVMSATGPSGDQRAKGAGSTERSTDQALTSKPSYWKHVFAVVMQPCMMATAQPAHFQRLVVVIVMRINRFDAANLTALLVEFA